MIKSLSLRFLESYFKHRWLYLLPLLLMIVVAAVYFSTIEPKFVSRGNLFVQKETLLSSLNSVRSSDISWWITPAQNVTNQINDLLRTDAFVRAVISKTDLEKSMTNDYGTIQELLNQTRASIRIMPLGESQIQVYAAYETPEIAFQITNAVIESYIQWQVNNQRTQSEAARTFFSTQIDLYWQDLEVARQNVLNFLEVHPEPLQGNRPEIEQMELNRLMKEMELTEKLYTSAMEKEENARLSLAQIDSDTRQSYVIIDAPRLPEKPEVSKREMAIQAAVFLVVGIVLSILVVVGDMLIDRTFRFPVDVQQIANLPVLATVNDMYVPEKWYQRFFRRRKKEKPAEASEQEELPAVVQPMAEAKVEEPEASAPAAQQEEKPQGQTSKSRRKGKRSRARTAAQEKKAAEEEVSSEPQVSENEAVEELDLQPVAIELPEEKIRTEVTV